MFGLPDELYAGSMQNNMNQMHFSGQNQFLEKHKNGVWDNWHLKKQRHKMFSLFSIAWENEPTKFTKVHLSTIRTKAHRDRHAKVNPLRCDVTHFLKFHCVMLRVEFFRVCVCEFCVHTIFKRQCYAEIGVYQHPAWATQQFVWLQYTQNSR